MWKKLWKFFFISHVFILLGCVPMAVPPPAYQNVELSLPEVLSIAGGGLDSIKAEVNVNAEKDEASYDIGGLIFLKRPDWLHLKLYNFGMVVFDLTIKGDMVSSSKPNMTNSRFKELGMELYRSIFWFEGLENANMRRHETEYIILTPDREIRIDRATLLPKSQKVILNGRRIDIFYDEPRNVGTTRFREGNLWYPSVVKINTGKYKFTLTLKKFLLNPASGEEG
ncbi:MAG: hypothetical protein HZC12_02450 [Nitrospirae bacterium]|nr:hypothetical protein [Nitrospirota bacterium]